LIISQLILTEKNILLLGERGGEGGEMGRR